MKATLENISEKLGNWRTGEGGEDQELMRSLCASTFTERMVLAFNPIGKGGLTACHAWPIHMEKDKQISTTKTTRQQIK